MQAWLQFHEHSKLDVIQEPILRARAARAEDGHGDGTD